MAKTKGKLTTADYLPIEEFERLVEGLRNDNQHLWELYGTHFMDSHHDLGELYITENDIYPYNPDAGRTYRYWGCEAKTKPDERHTHITKWDRERAKSRK